MDSKKYQMPLKDMFFLSPIEKYIVYGKFPFIILINFLLAIAVTSQILLTLGLSTFYTRAQERFFHEQFIDSGISEKDVEFTRKIYIYTKQELKEKINETIVNYYKIPDSSIDNITFKKNNENEENNLEMEIFYDSKYYDHKNKENFTHKYYLNMHDLGPFNDTFPEKNLSKMIRHMKYFNIKFGFKTYSSYNFGDFKECFIWNLNQIYSFKERSHFSLVLDIDRNSCEDIGVKKYPRDIKNYYWIHFIVLILSLINLIFTLITIYRNIKVYFVIKLKNQNKYIQVTDKIDKNKKNAYKKWELLTDRDKRKFISTWNILSAIGNMLQFFGALISILEMKLQVLKNLMIGLGCFMAYLSIARNLDYLSQFSSIFNTIRRSVPNIIRYFIGVMPIFLGFLFFGYIIFWRSERFNTIPMIIVTLFANMNGDSVYNTIKNLTNISFLIGQIYMYIYDILFIAVVMNIFISIIEEAYVNSKINNKNHWIYSFLHKENKKNNNEKNENMKQNDNDNKEKSDLIKEEKRKFYELARSKNTLRKAINFTLLKNDDEEETEDLMPKDKDDDETNEDQEIVFNYQTKDIKKKETEKNTDDENKKEEKEQPQTDLFNKFTDQMDRAFEEVNNLAQRISSNKESQMKKELKLFLVDNINKLEQKIIQIQSNLQK